VGSVNVRQRISSSFAAPLAVVLSTIVLSTAATPLLVGCGDAAGSALPSGGDVPGDPAFPATLDECGESLNVLLDGDADDEAEPRLGASYSEALASWSFPDEYCGLGIFRGVCNDGKRVLYRNGGFTSEIRYYDGEQLVGYVGSGDVGICPSVCPFSRFFGTPESVRCEAPSFEALCESVPAPTDGAGVWMPFANGEAPGGCDL
jgi:hypothetical protein